VSGAIQFGGQAHWSRTKRWGDGLKQSFFGWGASSEFSHQIPPLPAAGLEDLRSSATGDKRGGSHLSTSCTIDASILAMARAAARRIQPRGRSTSSRRASVCLSLLDQNHDYPALADFKTRIAALPIVERHYWIGTLYTLLLSAKARREQAAYFTPPLLAEAVIDLARIMRCGLAGVA